MICLTDLFATVVSIVEANTPKGSCEDSVSFCAALSGNKIESTRKGVIHHSFSGHFACRQDNWKLILARGSGGWTSPRENEVKGDFLTAQLYDLEADPGENTNLYLTHPEIAKRLLKQLKDDVFACRSTKGQPSKNDVEEIVLWKSERGPKRKQKK